MDKSRINAIDTHAHPDHPLYAGAGPLLVREQQEAGIEKVVVSAIEFESNETARTLFDGIDNVFYASGLHPKFAMNEPDWTEEKIRSFEDILKDPRTVAIKTGLDFSKKNMQTTQVEREKAFLKRFFSYGEKYRLPLVLHIRDAVEELLEVLAECPLRTEAEIHCYCYDMQTAEELVRSGIRYFGIGGAFTRTDKVTGEFLYPGLRDFVRLVPPDMILLETDAPFQRPGVCRPRSIHCSETLNTSLSIYVIAEEIAKLRNISPEEVISASNENAERFFRFSAHGYRLP